ncbi:hypothetical protein [Mycobacteroides sp. LB1]|uniref:hypothetical protein n=1 Tax=Mycobacteroides sp. LB1 TaxID=2750814 RepID=UPI0015DE35C8|nr:hypothetical protein [Mycobacteroides sp. LB1]
MRRFLWGTAGLAILAVAVIVSPQAHAAPDLSGYSPVIAKSYLGEYSPYFRGRGGFDVYAFSTDDGLICQISYKDVICGRVDGSLPGMPAASVKDGYDLKLTFEKGGEVTPLGLLGFDQDDNSKRVNGSISRWKDRPDLRLPARHKLTIAGEVSRYPSYFWVVKASKDPTHSTDAEQAEAKKAFEAAWVTCATDGQGMTTCQNSLGRGFAISENELTLY